MTFREIKNKYNLDAEKLAKIFGLKNGKTYAHSSAKNRYEKAVVELYHIFTENKEDKK